MGVLQVFERFYEARPAGSQPEVGDIYWVPVAETSEVPRILDVQRADPRNHRNVGFEICEVRPHHFTQRPDRLPIKLLTLGATEELLVAKAKRRLAVVLCTPSPVDVATLPEAVRRVTAALGKRCFLAAPLYSPATLQNPGTMMPPFVARVRALRYPQFACLPRLGQNDAQPGEIVRLDRIVATYLLRGCESSGWRLNPEIVTLLHDQLMWALNSTVSDYLQTVIDTAALALPAELA